MAKIKKGDQVVVIAGRDKKMQGRVLRVLPDEDRVVVEGVALATRHRKASQTSQGGIEKVESSIHISNVMIVDPETKKGTRMGSRTETVERDGRERQVRVRVAKRSGKDI